MQAHRLPARQGVAWIIIGFRLFRANMPLLSILTFVFLMTFTLMLKLSIIGAILFTVAQPAINLAIANVCRAVSTKGRQINAQDLQAGLRTRRTDLLKLGGLQLMGSILLMLIMAALDIKPDPAQPEQLPRIFAVVALLSSPMLLAFWFAPILCGWHDLPPLKALFFSLVAGLRNWRAFVIYALSVAAIIVVPSLLATFATQVSATFGQIVATAVEIVIVIVMLPVVLTGAYVSYRDIFTVNDDAAP